jgi:hypothetical protein
MLCFLIMENNIYFDRLKHKNRSKIDNKSYFSEVNDEYMYSFCKAFLLKRELYFQIYQRFKKIIVTFMQIIN